MMQTGRLFTGGDRTSPHVGCVLASYLRGPQDRSAAARDSAEPIGPTGGNLPHGQDRRASWARPLTRSCSTPIPRSVLQGARFAAAGLRLGDVAWSRGGGCGGRSIEGDLQAIRSAPADARLLDANFEPAFRLMTSPQARQAFDISARARRQSATSTA